MNKCLVCKKKIKGSELKTRMVLNPITAATEIQHYHKQCYYTDFTKLEAHNKESRTRIDKDKTK